MPSARARGSKRDGERAQVRVLWQREATGGATHAGREGRDAGDLPAEGWAGLGKGGTPALTGNPLLGGGSGTVSLDRRPFRFLGRQPVRKQKPGGGTWVGEKKRERKTEAKGHTALKLGAPLYLAGPRPNFGRISS